MSSSAHSNSLLSARTSSRSRSQWYAPIAHIQLVWNRHRDLLGGASSLAATTCITSALGFAYWAVAARLFTEQSVGYGSAAVSAMTLFGTVGMLGLGTVLIGELPRREARSGLISAALLTSGLGSLLFGMIFILVGPHISNRFHDMSQTPVQIVIFIIGVALTAVTMVFDQATIGLMRGSLQLSRNLAFALVKLAILPAVTVVVHDQLGVGITLSWVVGIAASVVPLSIQLRFSGSRILAKPDWAILRGLGKTALAHNWLNLAIAIPRSFTPVLVTVIVSPRANAAFYAAWTLTGFLYTIPANLTTVLFAIAAADPNAIARKLRFSLRLSFFIGVPGIIALCLGAHLALSVFGASYARAATIPMLLLLIGYLPIIPKQHYIAVCRASGRVSRAAAVLTVSAIAEVIAATAGGKIGGLKGLTTALVTVFILEGVVTAPTVLRTALGKGRHRRKLRRDISDRNSYESIPQGDKIRSRQGFMNSDTGLENQNGLSRQYFSEDYSELSGQRERQEKGIAMLLTIARSAGAHIPSDPP
jgi:O-antigen/teichoic acid export membrane protein